MGGIVGNLYDSLNAIGQIFFVILIGEGRALRPQLQDARVRMGGFLVFGIIGFIISFLLFQYHQADWFNGISSVVTLLLLPVLCGLGSGLIVGSGIIAGILISYAQELELEAERERREAEFEARRKEFYDELISQGVSPSEARRRAQSLGSGCGAVLAVMIILVVVTSAIVLF